MAARAIDVKFVIDLNVPPVNEEDEDGETPNSEIFQARKKNTKLFTEQRRAIYEALLLRSVHGKLKRNSTKEVSTLFSVPIYSVQRVWKRARESHGAGTVDVCNRLGNCGQKKIPLDLNRMTTIPLPQRTSLRSLAHGLGVNYTKLYRVLKQGDFRRHSNATKPYLKEEHKRARLQFCISMLEQNDLSHEPMFVTMHNLVHIDEKWFYMTKCSEKYYLLNSEEDPLRTCQSKNFIGKVMFLVAMARPRFDDEGNEVFSGKIGVFPFVHYQPAQRRSRNRDAGTMEMKPITSVKRETIKEFLITKVLPKIQEVWPRVWGPDT